MWLEVEISILYVCIIIFHGAGEDMLSEVLCLDMGELYHLCTCATPVCDMRPEHTFQYERGAIEEVNWCSMYM